MQLPAGIRQTLDDMLRKTPAMELSRAAAELSERYRRADGNKAIASANEAKAYAAVRLPATFCAASRAIETLCAALPGFSPTSMLDIGAGPATVALAALNRFSGLENITLVEPNAHLRDMGGEILRALHPGITANWHAESIERHAFSSDKYDLVTSGYVLNEIPTHALADTVHKMWQATHHTLLIVEPGTPFGQSVILQARDVLLKEGAKIAAPCPHALACPVATRWKPEEKWCHFSVRVERSRLHRQIKPDASLGYEDEKFSYIVATRDTPQTPRYRLIGHPRGKQVISTELCAADGTYQPPQISKSAPDYKAFRKADWGDGV